MTCAQACHSTRGSSAWEPCIPKRCTRGTMTMRKVMLRPAAEKDLTPNSITTPPSAAGILRRLWRISVAFVPTKGSCSKPTHEWCHKSRDTVGKPPSAENVASHMPSLKAQEPGESDAATAAVLRGNRLANSISRIVTQKFTSLKTTTFLRHKLGSKLLYKTEQFICQYFLYTDFLCIR